MEHDSLENLKAFLEEELYLIPEDLRKLEEELQGAESPNQIPMLSPENTSLSGDPEAKEDTVDLEELKEEIKPDPIPVSGNFSKGILILHEESELGPEVLDMLVKMINACGHSMNEVGMISSENLENRSLEEFQALNAHVVLKFGRIKHPINAIPANPYEIYSEEETEYLFADALSVIAEDKPLKIKLWKSLQILFNLSSGTK
ncbi:hypothetical protein CLV31_10714 [Algoriphagus aquaeductus]|uniref:Uncharacterized protein n=1 Tax=Algoriphagus aquaeductus TaxID=475299 RepID=A0A326RXM4_9BACT|nr:hypothetical protein [Algoriphagus aquaeductus]PZV83062.1 hypothetical protein CLV31_10714 [Algoriphagus aquaeductus]